MPVRTPPHEDCLHFAALLREALQQAKLVDPTQIGELVANAQQYPERQEIPYHPAVIESWLNGRAVPPPAAFEALHDMLADVVPSSFEDAYEAAYLQAPTKNEVGTVLHHRLKEQGLKLYDVGQKLLDAGTSHTGRPYSGGCVSYWCNGVHDVPSHVLLALDQLLPPQDTARIPLGTLVGLNKRQDSAERLAKATTTTDLHRALRYMRQALGFSNQRMADAISDKLTGESHVSNVSVLNWERLAHREKSHIPSNRAFGDRHPVDVYMQVLADHGFGEWAEANREHVHHLYQQASHGHFMPLIFQFGSHAAKTAQPAEPFVLGPER